MSRLWPLLSALVFSTPGLVQAAGFNPSDFGDPSQLVDPSIAKAMIQTVASAMDHHSYEGAAPLGDSLGLDFGIDATLAKTPESFQEALTTAQINTGNVPALPSGRIHIHKGLGPRFGVGLGWLAFSTYKLYSGEAKLTVFMPEEGPWVALRVSYTSILLGIINTHTWTPQVVVSKPLEFAEPYIGIGAQSFTGTIDLSIEEQGIPIHYAAGASGTNFIAYTGLQFNVPLIALQLTMEGSYNSSGAHSLGAKIGFRL